MQNSTIRELPTEFGSEVGGMSYMGGFATYQSKMLLRLKQALLFIAMAYLLMSPLVAMPLYNKVLFFPLKTERYIVDDLADVPAKEIFLPVDAKTKVHCWYFAHQKPKGMVIFCHGNGGNLTYCADLMEYFVKKGYSLFAFDYEGFGQSDGTPSLDGVCRDSLKAFDYVKQTLAGANLPVIVYGESLGGGVAGYLASNRKVDAIILQSTFSSLPEVAASNTKVLSIYPPILYPSKCLDTSSVLRKTHPPTLIIHGTADYTISSEQSELLYKNAVAPCRLALIANAWHGLYPTPWSDDFDFFVSGFLDDFKAGRLTAREDVSALRTPHQ
ncbi:MAG: alpha/beta fold hydrolase [Candidatus Obscuribacter sp.]|nr:alpha/beta fold hydrolase [Candidatus Obscuribacter sp.]MBP6594525.1 alpha/beta fold hydrolase [Candidatus Obscuribacter sp.]MBP7577095.1 alpha/beta fold hydrolase [Candidatus Obscuribacter sp.]